MTSATPLVGTVLDGKFRIDKALASGVAGDVYEALHLGLSARVAVKILRDSIPETIEIRRRRFVREARVAASMQSEHVVRVFDIVANEGSPAYIVMELLQGETLGERIRRMGALPVELAVDYILQAVKPLAEMHDAGIIHRDVKPSNLFVARAADGRERIKLLDFGVAALTQAVAPGESSLTLSEAIVGTPRYMAPEQVRGPRNVDARADVWALGVTLYEMLAGRPPFDGKNVLAVLNQIERQEPTPLAELCPNVPAKVAAVVHACLAKKPDARPADARALGADLGAAYEELRTDLDVAPVHAPLPKGAPSAMPSRTVWGVIGGLALAIVFAAYFAIARGPRSEPTATAESAANAPTAAVVPIASAQVPIAAATASHPEPSIAPSEAPSLALSPRAIPSARRVAPARTARPATPKPVRAPATREDDDDRLE